VKCQFVQLIQHLIFLLSSFNAVVKHTKSFLLMHRTLMLVEIVAPASGYQYHRTVTDALCSFSQ